ncbi:MAG: MobF family relaxase [Actinomycetota bacterium]
MRLGEGVNGPGHDFWEKEGSSVAGGRVLSVAKLVPDQGAYYEDSVARAREDYYAGRGEARGRWVGSGAERLGLSGEVADGALSAVLRMKHPATGEELRRPPKERTTRVMRIDPATGESVEVEVTLKPVAGFDLTFSVPKSLSVLEAVADPDSRGGRHIRHSVRAAHEEGMRAALSHLEREACLVRRGRGGLAREAGSGFVAAAFDHRASRARDPHRHTHVIVANVTEGPDGKLSALDGRALLSEHRLAAGYVYEAAVRRRMAEAGFRFGPVEKGMAELTCVPEAVTEEFSTRRREVQADMAAHGARGFYAAGAAARATRAPKPYGEVDLPWEREGWRARAAEHGLTRRAVERIGRDAYRRRGGHVTGPDAAGLLDELGGPQGLTELQTTFTRADVLRAVASAHTQGISLGALDTQVEALLQRDHILEVAHGRFTTTELLACEREIIDEVDARRGAQVGVLASGVVDRALARNRDRGTPLTDEQAELLRAITTSGNGCDLVQAHAGSGKTHALGALAECYRRAGHAVIGFAPTGRAARELRQAGVQAQTLDALVLALDRRGGPAPGRPVVLIGDEAGMMGTRGLAALVRHASTANAKVVLCGDTAQLPSVPAGGAFAALVERHGALTLTRVLRQRDPEHRRALAALREGDSEAYVRWQLQKGLLQLGGREDVIPRAVADWACAQAEAPPGEVILVCRDNALREELNGAARAEASRRGWLRGPGLEVAGREFRVGDRVIARRNDRLLDTDNGDRGTVVAIDSGSGTLRVATDDGRSVAYPAGYVARGLLEHAYAVTGHGAQGATVERAIVVARPTDHSAEWSYTAASRGRRASRGYLLVQTAAGLEGGGAQRPERSLSDGIAGYMAALTESQVAPMARSSANVERA